MQHLGAHAGHFQHLVIGDLVNLSGAFADIGIRGVDAVDIRIDFAFAGVEHSGYGDGRGIGAAAAESGDAAVGRLALEAGDDEDIIIVEELPDSFSVNGLDASRSCRP